MYVMQIWRGWTVRTPWLQKSASPSISRREIRHFLTNTSDAMFHKIQILNLNFHTSEEELSSLLAPFNW